MSPLFLLFSGPRQLFGDPGGQEGRLGEFTSKDFFLFFVFSLCARFSLGGQVCHFQELICEKEEMMVPPLFGAQEFLA